LRAFVELARDEVADVRLFRFQGGANPDESFEEPRSTKRRRT
jgi:hypothetical protein